MYNIQSRYPSWARWRYVTARPHDERMPFDPATGRIQFEIESQAVFAMADIGNRFVDERLIRRVAALTHIRTDGLLGVVERGSPVLAVQRGVDIDAFRDQPLVRRGHRACACHENTGTGGDAAHRLNERDPFVEILIVRHSFALSTEIRHEHRTGLPFVATLARAAPAGSKPSAGAARYSHQTLGRGSAGNLARSAQQESYSAFAVVYCCRFDPLHASHGMRPITVPVGV